MIEIVPLIDYSTEKRRAIAFIEMKADKAPKKILCNQSYRLFDIKKREVKSRFLTAIFCFNQ